MLISKKRSFHRKRVRLEDLERIEAHLLRLLQNWHSENSGEAEKISGPRVTEHIWLEGEESRHLTLQLRDMDAQSISKLDILQQKKVERIDLEFPTSYDRNVVSFSTSEGRYPKYNSIQISVSGESEDFVYANMESLIRIVDAMPSRFFLAYFWSLLLNPVLSIATYNGLYLLLQKLFLLNVFPPTFQTETGTFVSLVLSAVITLPIVFLLDRDLMRAFPNIEFDFGPEATRRSQRARQRLRNIWLLIVLPITASAAWDLIKWVGAS